MSELISRRQFAGAIAGTSALFAAQQVSESSQKTSENKSTKDEAEVRSTLELVVQIVRQEYPHEKLEANALEEIRSDVRSNLSRSKILSAFPLTNADEPGFHFAAWRKDGES